ncbi:SDR family oxidoreductase [Cellulomonas sp. ACRRI]|uniref:SDR family oxidoreductase n=1 Tax=Cellulomonas sp. ACRRI TaxID=2918188 RepID=UPI001EF2EA90|nr:SDR family oxidoreductase [Cellulomonas sp. ACRRI]MCG7285198.1 SDR family oxidoreductase [Cellulomonas sp. ACRRI]
MRVFVTGASGWIGSAAVPELLAAGHDVVGLARSEASAASLAAAGVEVRRGDLDDLAALRAGAEDADAVLHLAFKHDFSDMAGSGRTERAAVEALGDVLAGTDRPLLLASGIAGVAPGRLLTEDLKSPYVAPDAPRGASETYALGLAERGVRPVALRFAPTVHGSGDHGFVAELVRVARQRGVAGYVGDGSNRWPAVHRSDAGRLIALALARAAAQGDVPVVHAAGEEGVPARDIAEAIGRSLGVPAASVAAEEATTHFGWIGGFFALDLPASSALTRERLGWRPTGPTLLEDLTAGAYTPSR